jgi:hypothetical protein
MLLLRAKLTAFISFEQRESPAERAPGYLILPKSAR